MVGLLCPFMHTCSAHVLHRSSSPSPGHTAFALSTVSASCSGYALYVTAAGKQMGLQELCKVTGAGTAAGCVGLAWLLPAPLPMERRTLPGCLANHPVQRTHVVRAPRCTPLLLLVCTAPAAGPGPQQTGALQTRCCVRLQHLAPKEERLCSQVWPCSLHQLQPTSFRSGCHVMCVQLS